MLEFVILYHDMPAEAMRASHWDLMLLDGDRLLTWALDDEPMPGKKIRGRPLPDHHVRFLTYEGEISGARGQVRRILKGNYEWTSRCEPEGWEIRLYVGDAVWKLQAQWLVDQWLSDQSIIDQCLEFVFS